LENEESEIIEAQCFINEDQRGAFGSKLRVLPTPVVIDPEFTEEQVEAIRRAIGTWNEVGQGFRQTNLFATGVVAPIPVHAKNASEDWCKGNVERDDTLYIVRERSASRWRSLGFGDSAMAVTWACRGGAGRLRLIRQVMLIHSSSNMEAVTLHELGHAAGLNHSCAEDVPQDGEGVRMRRNTFERPGPDYRACKSIRDDHDYAQAVMHPQLDPRNPKRRLHGNDISRARCFYGPE
jgi:hypothetical protein